MTPLQNVWNALNTTPILWLTLTLLIYQGAQWICNHAHSPCINPVLISIIFIGAILLITRTPYEIYFEAARFLHFLLGPATVALAVPLYKRVEKLRRLLRPIAIALLAGSLTAIVTAVGFGDLFGASPSTLRSLAPKSVTTAIAIGISEQINGLPPLTAVLVILTGILGASIAEPLLNALGIKQDSARGFAMGVASHGIGTARAFEISEEAGAFSGLGMGLNGILTALLIPLLAQLMGWI
jgi:predicted murein hydrolase (TIGR00659 family)